MNSNQIIDAVKNMGELGEKIRFRWRFPSNCMHHILNGETAEGFAELGFEGAELETMVVNFHIEYEKSIGDKNA